MFYRLVLKVQDTCSSTLSTTCMQYDEGVLRRDHVAPPLLSHWTGATTDKV